MGKGQKFGGYLLYAVGIVCGITAVLEKRSFIWMLLSGIILSTGVYFLVYEGD